jgi:co-chaperonin GroES (HSP10)
MKMNIKAPVGARLLVEILDETPSNTTESGLFLPDSTIAKNAHAIRFGTVLSVGNGCTSPVQVGDVVWFIAAPTVLEAGDKTGLIDEAWIQAIVEEATNA